MQSVAPITTSLEWDKMVFIPSILTDRDRFESDVIWAEMVGAGPCSKKDMMEVKIFTVAGLTTKQALVIFTASSG